MISGGARVVRIGRTLHPLHAKYALRRRQVADTRLMHQVQSTTDGAHSTLRCLKES